MIYLDVFTPVLAFSVASFTEPQKVGMSDDQSSGVSLPSQVYLRWSSQDFLTRTGILSCLPNRVVASCRSFKRLLR